MFLFKEGYFADKAKKVFLLILKIVYLQKYL